MDALKDLLSERAKSLKHDSRADELDQIQHELNRLFGRQVSAHHIDRQTNQLFIHVPSGSQATLVRYGQVQILASIRGICEPPIEKVVILIRHPE